MIMLLTTAVLSVAFFFASAADKDKDRLYQRLQRSKQHTWQRYRDEFDLAAEHLGEQIGGLPVEIIYCDDHLKPDLAKSVAERMIRRDGVDLLAGFNFANTLLATVIVSTDAKKLNISSNAGPWTSLGRNARNTSSARTTRTMAAPKRSGFRAAALLT